MRDSPVASARWFGDVTTSRPSNPSNPLIRILFWLAVICCVAAQAAIVRSALREPAPADAPGRTVPTPRRWTEILWTVLPAIALVLVFAATWSAIRAHEATANGSAAVSIRSAP